MSVRKEKGGLYYSGLSSTCFVFICLTTKLGDVTESRQSRCLDGTTNYNYTSYLDYNKSAKTFANCLKLSVMES